MSRYDAAYKGYSGIGKVKGPSSSEVAGGQRASGTADIMRLLASAAPGAGTAIGGIAGGLIGSAAGGVGAIPGAGLGASIGGGLGQMAGGMLGSAADSQTKPYEDEAAKRDAKLQALMAVMGSRR